MTLSTISIGGNDYQAYMSVAEADAYLLVDPNRGATWATLTTDQKGTNLVAATRRLDLLNWVGEKIGGASQTTAWPRTGVTYPGGEAVADDAIPAEVENATAMLAGSIASDATVSESGTSGSNQKRVKAGSAEIEYFKATDGKQLQDETVFALIQIFVEGYTSTSSTAGAYASGATDTSSFEDESFGLTEGYA